MRITVKKLDESKLSQLQQVHLQVAKKIANGYPVFPATIHNSVHIIGAYHIYTKEIFIAPERLNQLKNTVNTAIHETAHAVSKADDGTARHERAISRIGSSVAIDVRAGKFDAILGGARW